VELWREAADTAMIVGHKYLITNVRTDIWKGITSVNTTPESAIEVQSLSGTFVGTTAE